MTMRCRFDAGRTIQDDWDDLLEGKVTHKQLVEIAKHWLERRHYATLTEIGPAGGEMPDAIGFKSSGSVLIECKSSRSDFSADSNKFFRQHPEFGMGMYRYFLCPHGLLSADEIPGKWGLLWVKSERVYLKKRPGAYWYASTVLAENRLLLSVIRRVALAECLDMAVSMEAKRNRLMKETVRIEREIRQLNRRLAEKRSRLEEQG